jgi:hypothetical protein
MNFSMGNLLAGLIFGGFGLFFFRLARKEGNPRLLAIGIALMAYPYFVENEYLCWGIGVGLTVLGFRSIE